MRKLELNEEGKVILKLGDKVTAHDGKQLEAVQDIEGNCDNCYYFIEGIKCDNICCDYNKIKLVEEKRGGNSDEQKSSKKNI